MLTVFETVSDAFILARPIQAYQRRLSCRFLVSSFLVVRPQGPPAFANFLDFPVFLNFLYRVCRPSQWQKTYGYRRAERLW